MEHVPYKGYIDILYGLGLFERLPFLLLVKPDTKYSAHMPVIIGTNVVNELMLQCRTTFEERYLQQTHLSTLWYICFREYEYSRKEAQAEQE